MPRRLRCADAGFVYHVLNRAVGRATLFRKHADYAAFENILREAHERIPLRLLAFVVMPNHWHLVVWPSQSGQLTAYLQWLTVTHVRRSHAARHTVGSGPIYQGRYKSFPIEEGEHFLTVCRYVERNPLRANLVTRAQDWRWSSLWHRVQQTGVSWLSPWPMEVPVGWTTEVNRAQTETELAGLRQSVVRGVPYGEKAWQQRTAAALGLESTLRPRGRPRVAKP
jgi:putative transposase